jgi:hypothetical protein
MPGAIDIVINLHTPEVLPLKPKWRKDFIGGKIGADAEILEGLTIEKYIERMDRAVKDIHPTGSCPMRS